jgi:hypothetical protein
MVEILENCHVEINLELFLSSGVYCVELEHSGISNGAKKPYQQIMYSFISPMKGQLILIRSWTQ